MRRMKSKIIPFTVAAGLLLAATPKLWALPPYQHTASGVIKAIDYNTHTITLASPKGDQLVFVWKDSTRFSQGWRRICLGALEPGQPVKVHYRREVGQRVPREVSLRKETPTRCTTGACCAKQR
jgi:hypothetical protein